MCKCCTGEDTLENRPPGIRRGKSDFQVKPLSNSWTKKIECNAVAGFPREHSLVPTVGQTLDL